MKTHTIIVKEEEFNNSKYNTVEWEKRVNITTWEHDYVDKVYRITIKIK